MKSSCLLTFVCVFSEFAGLCWQGLCLRSNCTSVCRVCQYSSKPSPIKKKKSLPSNLCLMLTFSMRKKQASLGAVPEQQSSEGVGRVWKQDSGYHSLHHCLLLPESVGHCSADLLWVLEEGLTAHTCSSLCLKHHPQACAWNEEWRSASVLGGDPPLQPGNWGGHRGATARVRWAQGGYS